MKRLILLTGLLLISILGISQNYVGYKVKAMDYLEAKDAFVIGSDTLYNTTQLSGLDTFLVTLEYLKAAISASITANYQNISGSGLSGNTLTIGIENGSNETVDLSSLDNSGLTLQDVTNNGATTTNNLTLSSYGSRIDIGSSSGMSSQMGGKRLTSGGLNYSAYWAYDAYWSPTDTLWKAKRESLGRKFMQKMSYHDGAITWNYYNGSKLTTGWEDTDWTQLMRLDLNGNLDVTGKITLGTQATLAHEVPDLEQVEGLINTSESSMDLQAVLDNGNTATNQRIQLSKGGSVYIGLDAGTNDDESTNENVGIGHYTMKFTTSGAGNTAIGYTSLYNNTTGNYNLAAGFKAGRYIADNTNNTTSDYSIYLGYNTKAKADNDKNEIVIGYNATGNGSNTIQLGNTSITNVNTSGTMGCNGLESSSAVNIAYELPVLQLIDNGSSQYGTNLRFKNNTKEYRMALKYQGSGGDNFLIYDRTRNVRVFEIDGTDGSATFQNTITHASATLDSESALLGDVKDVVSDSISAITETDPIYSASQASNITSTDITNLGNLSGTNTGDQDITGIATNTQAIKDTASNIRSDIFDAGANYQVAFYNNGKLDYASNLFDFYYSDVNRRLYTYSVSTGSIYNNMDFNTYTISLDKPLRLNKVSSTPTSGIEGGEIYFDTSDNNYYGIIDEGGGVYTRKNLSASASTDYISDVSLSNNTMTFTGTGSGFDGTVTNVANTTVDNNFSANQSITKSTAQLTLDGTSGTSGILRFETNGAFNGGLYAQNSGVMDIYAGGTSYFNLHNELRLVNESSPNNTQSGNLYFDTDDNTFRGYNGSSWVNLGGSGGDVSKVGTPANNQVGIWTGDGTIEGDGDLTFDGTNITVGGSITSDENRIYALGDRSGSLSISVAYGYKFTVNLTGDFTLALTGIKDGAEGSIELTQNSTGGYSFTLDCSGYTETIMGTKDEVDQTASSHTTVIYWRSGTKIYYGFLYDN